MAMSGTYVRHTQPRPCGMRYETGAAGDYSRAAPTNRTVLL